MAIDTTELFNEQPLIEEGNNDELQDGGDYESTESNDSPPESNDDSSVGDPPSPGKKVPLGALHEERTKRQQTEADLAAERQRNQVIQDRFNKFLMDRDTAQQQVQQVPPEAPPAFEEDPAAAFSYVQRQLQETQQRMQQYLEQQNTQQAAQQQHVQLAQSVSAQETVFTQAVPDYPQAADHFYQRKVAEYTAICGDEQRAKAQVANDYRGIAALAQQLGKNPAELMYNAARAMGYTPGKPGQQQRREAPTSLSNLSGTAQAPDEKSKVSASDISNMSDAEFEKFWNEDVARGNRNQRPKI